MKICFTDYAPRIQLPDSSKLAINWKNGNGVTIFQHHVIVIFFLLSSISLVNFSLWSKFHVYVITGSGIITIFFIRDWPESQKSEIPLSAFCPITGDWGELRTPNLARMSQTKCYWMLQNYRVSTFTIS